MNRMDEITFENLKSFYEINKSYLDLEVSIDKWKSVNDENLCLFSSNKSVKGKIIFTTKYSKIIKLGHFLLPIKMSVEEIILYGTKTKMVKDGEFKFPSGKNGNILFERLIKLNDRILSNKRKIQGDEWKKQKERKEKYKKLESERLKESKNSLISKLDKDNNGIIDVIEDNNEFSLLMKKHQKVIIEKGKEFNQNYTHQFIKVGNYIKKKRNNLQLIFDSLKEVQNQKDLSDFVKILENEIHTYNLLLFNSLNLIVSLIEDDQITFYDIYEKFDKLNIFNSNWENELSDKLTTLNKEVSELNSNIKGLMNEISEIGYMIWSSLEDLSYITENSTNMLNNRLGEINSSLNTNNLLTMIQTYQTYQINKNTKSLRG